MKKYFWKWFVCLFVSLFIIESLFKAFAFSLFNFEWLRIFLFTATISLLLAFICSLLKPWLAKIIICLSVFVSGLYALLELSFKNFMGNFMSISMLTGGGEADRISTEVATFISEIRLEYYLCLLPFVILIILFIWKKKWFLYEKPTWLSSMVSIVIIVVVHVLSLTTLFITPSNQIKTNKELYKNPNLVDISLKELGANRFLWRDFLAFVTNKGSGLIEVEKPTPEEPVEPDYTRFIDDSEWITMTENEKDSIIKNLHQYYQSLEVTPKNEYTGIFKDKNLIMIMVEALDMIAIDPEITPTLYKMQQEGWYFNNYYAPKFSCTTGESEFIALTGIIPSNTVCTPYTYVDNNYSTSIFNLFNHSNYTSTSYHSWNDQYYPRKRLHKNMGSSYFYNDDDLHTRNGRGWPSDVDLITKAYDIFSKQDNYFSFIITASMHFTYDSDSKVVLDNWDKVKYLPYPTPIKRYLAKAVEFDKAMAKLLEMLEADGTLDDTVIAFFGDHHPYNLNFDEINKLSPINRYDDLNEDLMPFIIYNHGQEPKVIEKVGSTFDVLPTLANLFDLNYDPRYYTGKDFFSDNEGLAIFPSGSWVSDSAIYFSSKNNFKFKNQDLGEDYIAKMNKMVSNQFTASDNTLKKDYFQYRFPN